MLLAMFFTIMASTARSQEIAWTDHPELVPNFVQDPSAILITCFVQGEPRFPAPFDYYLDCSPSGFNCDLPYPEQLHTYKFEYYHKRIFFTMVACNRTTFFTKEQRICQLIAKLSHRYCVEDTYDCWFVIYDCLAPNFEFTPAFFVAVSSLPAVILLGLLLKLLRWLYPFTQRASYNVEKMEAGIRTDRNVHTIHDPFQLPPTSIGRTSKNIQETKF